MSTRRPAPTALRRARKTPKVGGTDASGTLVEVRVRSDRAEDEFSELLSDPKGGVRLVACREMPGRPGSRLVRWVEVETSSAAGGERVRELVRRAGASSVSIAHPSSDRALLRLTTPIPSLCAAVFAAGAMCVSCPLLAPGHDEGARPVRLLVPRNGDARRLRRELGRRLDGHLTVERTGTPRLRTGLTARQSEAFRTALELGYFSYPRRADLATVARRLGVGRSTTLELLRHAIDELGRREYPTAGSSRAR